MSLFRDVKRVKRGFSSGTPNLRIAAVLAVMACGTTGCDKLGLGNGGNPNTPTPTTPLMPGAAVVYSAIGGSDATGHGSSNECLIPFGECPDGLGYVPVAIRTLKGMGFTVTSRNLGIPTAVISRAFQTLGQQYGRTIVGNFIDSEMPFILPNSTLVTIFAGANDVNTITAALGGGAGGSDPAGYIDREVAAFGVDYAALVSGIRDRAGGARVVVVNLPNLGALPYLAAASLAQRQAAQRAAVGMTVSVINKLPSVAIVDLMCDARTYLPSTYSADGFHPSDAGYAIIANEIVLAATTSYAAPRSTCSQMTVVPN
jgi:lysophospholipase L1-like esterase